MTEKHQDQNDTSIAQRFYDSLIVSRQISREQLNRYQQEVATTLLEYVSQHSAWHANRMAPVLRNGQPDFNLWREILVLTKQELLADYHLWRIDDIPQSHGRLILTESSSSTGIAVALPKTQMTDTATACAGFRHAALFGIDYRAPLVMLRSLNPMLARIRSYDVEHEQSAPVRRDQLWGPSWLDDSSRGPRHVMSVGLSCDQVLNRLDEIGGDAGGCYLNTSPSKALDLADHVRIHKRHAPPLKAILSVGEVATAAHRHEIRTHLDCELIDVYATAETGPLAMQCPESGFYHVQSELGWVELLNETGSPAQVGETGRVVVTPFYNLAMPLIRFDTGDLAVAGAACKCNSPHPVITKILGRSGVQLRDRKGRFISFSPDFAAMREHLGNCRWRLTQSFDGHVELQYMQTADEEKINGPGAAELIHQLCKDADFDVSVREIDVLGLTGGGKFALTQRLVS